MQNWAVVIGIDEYEMEEARLRGAVSDALKVTSWLQNPKGGNVPRQNMFLLLGRSPSSPEPAPTVTFNVNYDNEATATGEEIRRTLGQLILRSGGRGERLFFYYSGHGLTTKLSVRNESALVPSDFSDLLYATPVLILDSLYSELRKTNFKNQFFFIDGCRDIPYKPDLNLPIGTVTLPPVDKSGQVGPVQQFIFCATSEGETAAEMQQTDGANGAFTTALLAGLLQGKGKAKAWDAGAEQYVVGTERLCEFVTAEVEKQLASVAEADAIHRGNQVPQLEGQRSWNTNPILAEFRQEDFSEETLSVYVDPTMVAPQSEVSVWRDGSEIEKKPGSEAPIRFMLQPKEYNVRASAPNHISRKEKWPVELYDPEEVAAELESLGAVTVPASPPPPSGPPDSDGGPGGGSTLIVHASDPLAPLEVTDNTGKVAQLGQGQTEVTALKRGFYRARLRTPEGQYGEQLLELLPSRTETAQVKAPELPKSRLLQEVIESAGFRVRSDNTLEISDASEDDGLDSVAAAQVSTILTLAGSTAIQNVQDFPARRLRSLGLDSFRPDLHRSGNKNSGVQFLFGVDSETGEEAREYLAGVKVRAWGQHMQIPQHFDLPVAFSEVDGLAVLPGTGPPGFWWLSIELPDRKPVVLPLRLLPQRVTMLVFQREADGQAQIFQYMPGTDNDVYSQPIYLRLLELVQRFHQSGRLDMALQSAVNTLGFPSWRDPIAGCLGGYLLLTLGKVEDLGIVAANMVESFDGLSDSYVLQAEYEARLGEHYMAEHALRKALDRGLPIFKEGLALLLDGVQRYKIVHPQVALMAEMFRNCVRSLNVLGWTPQVFQVGEALQNDIDVEEQERIRQEQEAKKRKDEKERERREQEEVKKRKKEAEEAHEAAEAYKRRRRRQQLEQEEQQRRKYLN